jgi:hypothetical protein
MHPDVFEPGAGQRGLDRIDPVIAERYGVEGRRVLLEETADGLVARCGRTD